MTMSYKMLFISTCNYYSSIMPFMFESIADYTELLLLPDDLLSANSIRNKVIDGMEREDCSDIGSYWDGCINLYQ